MSELRPDWADDPAEFVGESGPGDHISNAKACPEQSRRVKIKNEK
jgi:hypothetical protein